MFSEVAEIALVAARLVQFQQLLKTRVILILNFTRPHVITYTNSNSAKVRAARAARLFFSSFNRSDHCFLGLSLSLPSSLLQLSNMNFNASIASTEIVQFNLNTFVQNLQKNSLHQTDGTLLDGKLNF